MAIIVVTVLLLSAAIIQRKCDELKLQLYRPAKNEGSTPKVVDKYLL